MLVNPTARAGKNGPPVTVGDTDFNARRTREMVQPASTRTLLANSRALIEIAAPGRRARLDLRLD